MNDSAGDLDSDLPSETAMSVRARQMARRKDLVYRPGTKRAGTRLPPVKPDNEKLMRSEELDEELLSGIANEITWMHIIPKLPWRALFVLSSVCRGWKRAFLIGAHRYHDERVRSNSTETLAVVDVTLPDDQSHAIALYSVRDKRFYYVPPIPCFRGFPLTYECVAVDSKLYVLGGRIDSSRHLTGKEVYVLDLVGERRWRQCESMRKLRNDFGCGVMDGKIYIFGGTVPGAEVYDLKLNSWSPIRYDGVWRLQQRVTVVGEEFVLHGGMNFKLNSEEISGLEFYNPVTTAYSYRVVDGLYFEGMDVVSGTQGNFYSIAWPGIDAHHVDNDDTATHRRSFFAENVWPHHVKVERERKSPFVFTVVDDELLAVVRWVDTEPYSYGSCLVRSRGFSTENKQICWEKAPCSGKHSCPIINHIKCSIQL